KAVHHAAQTEVEQLLRAVDGDGDGGGGGSAHVQAALLLDWDALYADESYGGFEAVSGFGLAKTDDDLGPVEDRAATMYRFGRGVSGMTFSPSGDVWMVLYDHLLQGRLSGKRHMEPLWSAAGWQPGVPVTRHQARLRRPAIRELGVVGEARSCLDDPWE